MIKDINTVLNIKPSYCIHFSSEGHTFHWFWWILALLLFWPALIIMAYFSLIKSRYDVSLYDDCNKLLYKGYVNKEVFEYLNNIGMIKNGTYSVYK